MFNDGFSICFVGGKIKTKIFACFYEITPTIVVDPHWFRIRIQGFNGQNATNVTAKNSNILYQKV